MINIEYEIIERRTYIIDEKGNRKILIDKILKSGKHSYKIYKRGKTRKMKTEYYFNQLKEAEEKPDLAKRLEKAVEVTEEYEEYEYFIGFDYETQHTIVDGQKVYSYVDKTGKQHGKHDFKTEFRVSSPVKLTENEIRELIAKWFSDYAVLKDEESYTIKSESKTTRKSKPKIDVKFTKKIER